MVAKHTGVSLAAGPEVVTQADLNPLAEHHVGWIVQTPFGWQPAADVPVVNLKADGRVYWGERDVGLETTARLARELGIKTLLKPHLWVSHGASRLDVGMTSEADWLRWFESYGEFILHYARLAERLGIEALCVGTELQRTAIERPDDWRRLIARVRQVYGGELTYAANWWKSFEEIVFWDDLDYIGIQAYFPLSDAPSPTVDEMTDGWESHLPAIEAVQRRFQKPVLFTEIGYKGARGGAAKPWEWPQRVEDLVPDLEFQARAYEAFFRTFWHREWFAGAYFWKWHPFRVEGPLGDRFKVGFTPQGKPAATVMARWYGEEMDRRAE